MNSLQFWYILFAVVTLNGCVFDVQDAENDTFGNTCFPGIRCENGYRCADDDGCKSAYCDRKSFLCADQQKRCVNGIRDIEVGETDIDCGGDCPPCAVGRFCSVDADCAASECVPTENRLSGTTGQCWEPSYSGCAAIALDSTQIHKICGDLHLGMCQLASNSEMKRHCISAPNQTLPWSANFLCCDPSFL